MEVNSNTFEGELLNILDHISKAKFTAIDLEMSGINKNSQSEQEARRKQVCKPNLETTYQEMRKAAEFYTVIQVGICPVEEYRERGYHDCRPYNFNLSPLEIQITWPRFDMDRQIEFSGSACRFLTQHGFNFNAIFCSGVPYLSRVEEAALRVRMSASQNLKQVDLIIKPGDDSFEFYNHIKDTIKDWIAAPDPKDDYLNVNNFPDTECELNSLQKKIINQVLRNYYPAYKSVAGRNGDSWIRIDKRNPGDEARQQAKYVDQFNRKLVMQKGLGWIIEALMGGNLDGLTADWFRSCSRSWEDKSDVETKLKRIKTRLATKQHIVVGHNLFYDLGFLYATFIGPLPPTILDFKLTIKNLFPVVYDTKFLSSKDQTSMSPNANLKDTLRFYDGKAEGPMSYLHEGFNRYGELDCSHEAGYDAWMTAKLFIKLSVSLYNEMEDNLDFHTDEDYESCQSAQRSPSRSITNIDDLRVLDDSLPPAYAAHLMQALPSYEPTEPEDSDSSIYPTSSRITTPTEQRTPNQYDGRDISTKTTPMRRLTSNPFASVSSKTSPSPQWTKFAHDNPFNLIREPSPTKARKRRSNHRSSAKKSFGEMSKPTSFDGNRAQIKMISTTNGLLVDFANRTAVDSPLQLRAGCETGELIPITPSKTKKRSGPKKWLPGQFSSFWDLYINKLRVNSCEEGLCDLATTE